VLATLVWFVLAAGTAQAGLTANFGGEGATRPGELHTYVTVARGTVSEVQAINRRSGAVDRRSLLPGLFGAPQVSRDGAKTGLSVDGRTLVLSDVPHVNPVRDTHLLVLDARRLRVLQRIDLDGWYSVCALSPDGATLYLVRYLRDAAEVIAYDRTDRSQTTLARVPGSALSRATSPDGRIEYTLYGGAQPFVQALDTERASVERFGLPQLIREDLSGAQLRLSDGTLQIGDLATLDPARDDSSPWPLAGVGLVGLAALAVWAVRRRTAREGEDVEVIVHHTDP
jgi:MYXO-CTERM domain-containing protein